MARGDDVQIDPALTTFDTPPPKDSTWTHPSQYSTDWPEWREYANQPSACR